MCVSLLSGYKAHFIETAMNENLTVVFHGFLNLPNLEKLQMVEAINEYFDSNEKERIRAESDAEFDKIDLASPGFVCKCCGR
jgi:hypothetical protein